MAASMVEQVAPRISDNGSSRLGYYKAISAVGVDAVYSTKFELPQIRLADIKHFGTGIVGYIPMTIRSTGTFDQTLTVTLEYSNDGTNWVNLSTATSVGAAATTHSAAIFIPFYNFKYGRFKMAAASTGFTAGKSIEIDWNIPK